MTTITKTIASSLAAATMLAVAAPALAEDSVSATAGTGAAVTTSAAGIGVNADANAAAGAKFHRNATSTPGRQRTGTTSEERMQQRMQNGQDKGGQAIDQRITSLNQLLSRIGSMKLLTADEKSTLTADINADISTLTTLKGTISTDTSTTSLKADLQSITKANRIYLLVIPQGRVTAAADRVLAVVAQMQALSVKFGDRITQAGNPADLVSAHADFDAKVADAQTQANAAVALIAGLKPDNGDTSVQASNTATLKSAQTDIQTAQNDLKAARQDAQTIVKGVAGKDGSHATTTASATQ